MNEELWLGNQASYDAISTWLEARGQGWSAAKAQTEPAQPKPLFQMIDNIAIVNISGSLYSGYLPAWVTEFFGVMGYDNIREAVAAAANHPDVKGIVLNIDSPGGQANGVEDAANFIKSVRTVKPVVTYNAGTMASAAYWLGSAGQYLVGSNSSTNGSIGVKMVHIDRSKAMADMGYKATIVRHGENKALGDPMEPLSEKALAHFNAMAKTLGTLFEQAIADNLGMTLEAVQMKFEGGKEFLGVDAINIGLLTHLGNFETALSLVRSLLPSTGARTSLAPNRGNQMKTTLTAETPDTQTETPESVAALAELNTAHAALLEQNSQLTTQLADAATQIAGLKSERDTFSTSLETTGAQLKEVTSWVVESIKNMGVALNTAVVTEGDTAVLMAEYGRVSALYQSKFKVGGSSAVTPPSTEEPEKPKAAVNNLFVLAAARAATSR